MNILVLHLTQLSFEQRAKIPDELQCKTLGPWFVLIQDSFQGRYTTELQANSAASDLQSYFY